MSRSFNYKETVQLYHVDGARRLFYGQLFFLNHNALSAFLKEIGYSLTTCFQRGFQFPIVHVEGNYYKALNLEDEVCIAISVSKIGHSSFTLKYTLLKEGTRIADAQTVHVAIDEKTQEKISLPEEFRSVLSEYLDEKIRV